MKPPNGALSILIIMPIHTKMALLQNSLSNGTEGEVHVYDSWRASNVCSWVKHDEICIYIYIYIVSNKNIYIYKYV